ncbi:MAG: hypothetical protein PUD47_02065 [Bacteroidales bacterium]|nr:hypothetical protein [Bacteroidales bacterium]
MRQEEIVNEIRKKSEHVEMLPSMGWHFIYHARHFFYMMGRDDDMIRFSIPHLVKANGYDPELVSEAINETNRNVKFIKAVRLDCGSVSLDYYDHKTIPDEAAETIIPHIINALDFAAVYLLNKCQAQKWTV